MKLYSLVKNKRLIKSTVLKLNNLNSYLLLGATILAFGGFFYSQITFAKATILKTVNSTSRISITPTVHNQLKEISPEKKLFNSYKTNKPKNKLAEKNNKIPKIVSNDKQSKSSTNIKLSQLTKDLKIGTVSSQNKADEVNITLKDSIASVLVGTPMEQMIEPISKQNKTVAAFLVGIALKESGFGKHVPILNGQDCYNYWGYRGKRARMGTGGHTCFNSPEDAVETVGKRLHTLAIKQKRNTPKKMLIWKCGNSCSTHSPAGIAKWVSDVSIHFNQINNS